MTEHPPLTVGLPVVMDALAKTRTLRAVVVKLATVKTGFTLAHASHVGAPFLTALLLADHSGILQPILIVQAGVVRLLEEVPQAGEKVALFEWIRWTVKFDLNSEFV